MYDCKIIADSVSSRTDARLTTFEVTYPLIIHAEIMTHRVFSRNVASNRAIPVKKLVTSVIDNPFVPDRFPVNKAGMQNEEWLEGIQAEEAREAWLDARNMAVAYAEKLGEQNVHKQITNRLLAPFLWTTAVITATDWDNFFSLRCHPMAQPEIQKIAYMMRDAYESSIPVDVSTAWGWHLPYITSETQRQVEPIVGTQEGEVSIRTYNTRLLHYLIKVSIGRCARVSYLNHGENNTPEKDVELCERLIENKHMSPTEHVAFPETGLGYCGNFRGWRQYRKLISGESGQHAVRKVYS